MKRPQHGMTLVEVAIALAVLALFAGGLYAVLASSERHYEREMAQREAEWKVREAVDRIATDLRESSSALTRVQTLSDPLFPAAQTLIAAASARDAAGLFKTQNNVPQWQTLIVYAPYVNPDGGVRELRRYAVFSVEPGFRKFFEPGADPPPAISVTAADLRLEDVTVARASGEKILQGIDTFRVPRWTEPGQVGWSIELSVAGSRAVTRSVGSGSGVKGRN